MDTNSTPFLPPAKEVCEGYVFTGVCLSTVGGCLPHCMLGSTLPRSRHPARSTHPSQEHTPPRSIHPPCSACWQIRATSGRYASYWNAYLLMYRIKYAMPLGRIKTFFVFLTIINSLE